MKALQTMVDMPTRDGAFRIRQAVVALEMGPADEAVLDYVAFLSSQIGIGAAHFIHVLPAIDLYHALYEKELRSVVSNYTLEGELRDKMRETVMRRFEDANGTEISVEVGEGQPLKALLECAEGRSADLVIIGQQAGAAHHGILARNLARQTRGNALVVPTRSADRMQKLFVPVDFSPASGRALATALALRSEMVVEPEIVAVHLFEVPRLNLHQLTTPKERLRRIIAGDREASFKRFLEQYAPQDADQVQVLLRERDDRDTGLHLMQLAREQSADIVLLGAKGHTGVELLLLGSVAERMLALNEYVPTMIVR